MRVCSAEEPACAYEEEEECLGEDVESMRMTRMGGAEGDTCREDRER